MNKWKFIKHRLNLDLYINKVIMKCINTLEEGFVHYIVIDVHSAFFCNCHLLKIVSLHYKMKKEFLNISKITELNGNLNTI